MIHLLSNSIFNMAITESTPVYILQPSNFIRNVRRDLPSLSFQPRPGDRLLGWLFPTKVARYSLMVWYTPEFNKTFVDDSAVEAFVKKMIAEMNQGYKNSKIPVRALPSLFLLLLP